MPELGLHAPDNPDFARVLPVRRLVEGAPFDFDIAPTEPEAAALARLVGASSLRRMRFRGRLTPSGRGWRLDGTLGATVVQPCVVTLEPVTTRIDVPVARVFLPDVGRTAADIVLRADDPEDEPEPLGESIDLGLVATEALALAVPSYPRKPGAVLPSTGPRGDEDQPRPFAALAALRPKPGDGG